jgi:hypothetical protein
MSRFKFHKNKPKLTEQEISQHMNFEKFISGHTPPVKGWFSGTKLFTLVAAGTAVLITAVLLVFNSSQSPESAARFIDPPVKALDILPGHYVAQSAAETTITHVTGSTISVPANAFVDENGKDVDGNIEIRYREFHDPIDILLSGIPMNYDSAGISYQLESAGMFEVTAFRNGKEVFLKPGKQLLVNMISANNNPDDFNIYALDTTAKKWEYVSENTAKNNTCINLFNRVPEAQIQETATSPALKVAAKPILPKRSDPKKNNFSIDFLPIEFPELAAFEDLKFEPTPGQKTSESALAKRIWDDVQISRHADNQHYTVTFKSGKESHTIKVAPVVDDKNYEATLKEYNRKLAEYQVLLSARRTGERRATDSLYALNERFKGMAMSSDLNSRFDSFINDSYNETSKDLLAYRTFAISRLGTWNCDRPYPFFVNSGQNASGSCEATFLSENNETLLLKMVYLIRRSVNSLYTVSPRNFNNFPDCAGNVDVAVGITYDNQIYYLKGDELPQKNADNRLEFRMKKPAAGITSALQLKNLLQI